MIQLCIQWTKTAVKKKSYYGTHLVTGEKPGAKQCGVCVCAITCDLVSAPAFSYRSSDENCVLRKAITFPNVLPIKQLLIQSVFQVEMVP